MECHRRKVKCDVSSKGQPCSNCVVDEVQCEVVPRKHRAGRFSTSLQATTMISPSGLNTGYGITPISNMNHAVDDDSSDEDGRHAGALAAAIDDNILSTGDNVMIHVSFCLHFDAYTNQCKYTGKRTGIVGFVADLVGDGNPGSAHYLVPHTARRTLSTEELQYLRYKGVFSVPPKGACDILVRLYFLHVHPLLPILDATTFLG